MNNLIVSYIEGTDVLSRRVSHSWVAACEAEVSYLERGLEWKAVRLIMEEPLVF